MDADELFASMRRDYPTACIAGVVLTTDGDGARRIEIRTARPGILIGKHGSTVEALKARLDKIFGNCALNIVEIRRPELEPVLVADTVISKIERGAVLETTLDLWTKTPVRCGARAARIAIFGSLGEHVVEHCADESAFDWSDPAVVHAAIAGKSIRCEVWLALPLSD